MLYYKSIDEHVQEMQAVARVLLPYSFPITSPMDEEDIACLKQRDITVDGYDCVVFFNNCSYGDIQLKTLQVYGKDFCFLPFTVICKLARKFLGEEELGLAEIMHHKRQGVLDETSRKIYVWTVYYDTDGKPIEAPFAHDWTKCSYEGLNFAQVDRNSIKLF